MTRRAVPGAAPATPARPVRCIAPCAPGRRTGLALSTRRGIRAPAAIADRLPRAVAVAVREPAVRARPAPPGADPVADTPAALDAFCGDEPRRFGPGMRAASIRMA
jgi:tripartite-type tricarboxylate transporter receptor subunit TctC